MVYACTDAAAGAADKAYGARDERLFCKEKLYLGAVQNGEPR